LSRIIADAKGTQGPPIEKTKIGATWFAADRLMLVPVKRWKSRLVE